MKSILSNFSHLNIQAKNIGIPLKDRSKPTKLVDILKSEPMVVKSYDELVKCIAQVQYRSRHLNLYFRGQSIDYKKDNLTTILPSIYRKKEDKNIDLKNRFEILNNKVKDLRKHLNEKRVKFAGTPLINKYPEIAWAMLQHYEICDTPLIDITHSIHVACSFAFDRNKGSSGIVYVIGLPWQNDSIGYNSIDEIVNIKLLGVSPPQAQRPYFQEGYLAGPFPNYKLDDPSRIRQFDFGRRLIAKFKIPRTDRFWGDGFSQIPSSKLYQMDDQIKELCEELK